MRNAPLCWEVLQAVGADGIGGHFPYLFFFVFLLLSFVLRFSPFFLRFPPRV